MDHHVADPRPRRRLGPGVQRPGLPGDRAVPAKTSPACASCRRSPGARSADWVAELRRCVNELGFVGCNLNPDPSGGYWTCPAADRRVLVPAVRGDGRARRPGDGARQRVVQPGLPHASARITSTPTRRVFMQLLPGDLFERFPTLRFVIPHGGGAVPYHWGRYPRPARGTRGGRRSTSTCCATSSSTPASTTSPASTCWPGHPGRQHAVRAPRCSARCAATTRRPAHHWDDTKRYVDKAWRPSGRATGPRSSRATRAGSTPGSPPG